MTNSEDWIIEVAAVLAAFAFLIAPVFAAMWLNLQDNGGKYGMRTLFALVSWAALICASVGALIHHAKP
jgi:hypothetical protein